MPNCLGFFSTKRKRRKPSLPPLSNNPRTTLTGLCYVCCLRPFRALDYLKLDRITLLQRAVTISDDRRIVYEDIRPVFPAYESVSFRVIEPLYCSLHFVSPLAGDSNVSYSWGG
jgi:hypothetical protein